MRGHQRIKFIDSLVEDMGRGHSAAEVVRMAGERERWRSMIHQRHTPGTSVNSYSSFPGRHIHLLTFFFLYAYSHSPTAIEMQKAIVVFIYSLRFISNLVGHLFHQLLSTVFVTALISYFAVHFHLSKFLSLRLSFITVAVSRILKKTSVLSYTNSRLHFFSHRTSLSSTKVMKYPSLVRLIHQTLA